MEAQSKVHRYFACDCGHTWNAMVYRNTDDLKPTHKAGVYRVRIGEIKSVAEKDTCRKCSKVVESSPDPNGLPNKFYFNFMED